MTVDTKYPPETYSKQEQEKILELRKKASGLNLTEEQNEDAYLIRWLRARNLNIPKAHEMLKRHLEWRKENNVDGILEREDLPEEVKKLSPYAQLGVDREGCPLFLVPMGRQDMRTILEKFGTEEGFRINMIWCEKLIDKLKKIGEEQGRPVTQIVEIIDLEGYSYRQLASKQCRDFFTRMQTVFDANYPELLRYGLVINAPKIFYILFNIMKPFIPKNTLEKIDIYGPDKEKWQKALLERFPAELVPKHWGGTREGSDEYCSKDPIWVEGPVSLSFFNPEISDDDIDPTSFTSVTIPARDSLKIPLEVNTKGSSIIWRFKIDSYDIGFQIKDESGKDVVAYQRLPSLKKGYHEGSQSCEGKMGTFTFIFDNSYSFTRSKSVNYSVNILESDAEEEALGNGSPNGHKSL